MKIFNGLLKPGGILVGPFGNEFVKLRHHRPGELKRHQQSGEPCMMGAPSSSSSDAMSPPRSRQRRSRPRAASFAESKGADTSDDILWDKEVLSCVVFKPLVAGPSPFFPQPESAARDGGVAVSEAESLTDDDDDDDENDDDEDERTVNGQPKNLVLCPFVWGASSGCCLPFEGTHLTNTLGGNIDRDRSNSCGSQSSSSGEKAEHVGSRVAPTGVERRSGFGRRERGARSSGGGRARAEVSDVACSWDAGRRSGLPGKRRHSDTGRATICSDNRLADKGSDSLGGGGLGFLPMRAFGGPGRQRSRTLSTGSVATVEPVYTQDQFQDLPQSFQKAVLCAFMLVRRGPEGGGGLPARLPSQVRGLCVMWCCQLIRMLLSSFLCNQFSIVCLTKDLA